MMLVNNFIIVNYYMTKPFLVIGQNGQLGQSLQKKLKNFPKFLKFNSYINSSLMYADKKNFIFVSRKELDLSNPNSIRNYFKQKQFAGVINCAAYTSVENAEINKDYSENINHLAVAQLGEIAKNSKIPIIHISTDYVFDGFSINPYNEKDETNPINIYGLTKLRGEKSLIDLGCNGAIVRTSWLYSEFGSNFVKTVLDISKKQNCIKVVDDQIGSPTFAANLSNLILNIISNQKTREILESNINLYHFSDHGYCSRYDFAKAIIEMSKSQCKIVPIKTKDYPTGVRRPTYSVLNNNKIKSYIPHLKILPWQDSLKYCLNEINKNNEY